MTLEWQNTSHKITSENMDKSDLVFDHMMRFGYVGQKLIGLCWNIEFDEIWTKKW
jgi:hypothetical protein